MTGAFTHSIEVPAAPEVVFEYFIDPQLLVSWIGDYAVLDARPGGEFVLDIEGIPVRGNFLEIAPPSRVVISWGHAGSETMPPASTEVEFNLAPSPAGTIVTVEHRKLPPEHIASHRVGWPMFLGHLQQRAS